jgi:hypothetical protein
VISLLVEISTGEFIDKITILLVKKMKISSIEKLTQIDKELNGLLLLFTQELKQVVNGLYHELLISNMLQWEAEDKVREHIDKDSNTVAFYQKEIHRLNKNRGRIRTEIDNITNSSIREIKQYLE